MIKTKLKVVLIKNIAHKDYRGYFKELIRKINQEKNFLFLSSFSRKCDKRNAFTNKKSQGKFVSVIKGKIFDVVIDLRKNLKHLANSITVHYEKFEINLYTTGFAHGSSFR